MKIAIIGTRGIPNFYGGFEQFAQYLAVYLAEKKHDVHVYNSHNHPFQEKEYKGVKIHHCYDPEEKIGTAGQFIYDFNCILHSRKQNYDVILQLGYTSSSIWHFLLPKSSRIITNMDGLEWKRSKYSTPVQKFLKRAEKWAVNSSHLLVADSKGIQSYLKKAHQVDSVFIPYGADLYKKKDIQYLPNYKLAEKSYNLLIARMEPENHVREIIEAHSQTGKELVIIGNLDNSFGAKLKEEFQRFSHLHFLGGIYEMDILDELRSNCKLYFHGHSVGGTNPSLLEAMATESLICAHKNEFNQAVLNEDAFYFTTSTDIKDILIKNDFESKRKQFVTNNLNKIRTEFSWTKVLKDYENILTIS